VGNAQLRGVGGPSTKLKKTKERLTRVDRIFMTQGKEKEGRR